MARENVSPVEARARFGAWSRLVPKARQNLARIVGFAIAFCIGPRLIAAQAVPRTVSGVVRDTLGQPLEDAVVVLNPTEALRAGRADAAGRFRFDRINPGRYTMRTTWIGYVPDERTIVVPEGGLEVEIRLTPIAFRLDTLTVVARRTGIFGTTVERTDFSVLGGVEVKVLGTMLRGRTPADGKFSFGEVRFGGWVVQASRDGYATIMVPVVVPDTAAVELALAMDTARTKTQQVANNRIREMDMRINRRQANASAIVTRQEFGAARTQTLDIALRYAPSYLVKGLVLENVECIYVDGVPKPSLRAKDILAEDVALVEVYNHRGAASLADHQLFRNNGNACGAGPVQEVYGARGASLRAVRPPKETAVAFIYIWLK